MPGRGPSSGWPPPCDYAARVQRVVGIDVARGLAVLGMFVAHVGPAADDFWSPTGWLQVADGRSAATFALLAGVSAALLSGGPTPPRALRTARVRIVARAALIGLIGVALMALGTPVAVILPGYALMFAVLTGTLRWPRRALVTAAILAVVLGPPLIQAGRRAGLPDRSYLAELVVGEYYPALVWVAYLLVGLAVGRSDLSSPRVRRVLLVVGASCALVGHGSAAAAMRLVQDPALRALLTAEPHADTATEVVGSTGVVLVVLVVCLAIADVAPRLVAPVAATGALALTAYSTHIVVLAALGPDVVHRPRLGVLLAFVVVTLVTTTAWRARWGRGPLERLLHGVSSWAGAIVGAGAEPVRAD